MSLYRKSPTLILGKSLDSYSLEQLKYFKGDGKTLIWASLSAKERRAVTYRINSMEGKHKNTPAQKRARLLGQLKYYSLAAQAMVSQCHRILAPARDTDLSVWDVEELQMRIHKSSDAITTLILDVDAISRVMSKTTKKKAKEA